MSKSKETWWYCLRNSKSAFVTCLEIGRLFSFVLFLEMYCLNLFGLFIRFF